MVQTRSGSDGGGDGDVCVETLSGATAGRDDDVALGTVIGNLFCDHPRDVYNSDRTFCAI